VKSKPPSDLPSVEEAQRRYASTEGGRAAAWLVKSRAASLKRTGAFEIVIPKGTDEPLWITFALWEMRRTRRYEVTRHVGVEQTVIRVKWKPWWKRHPEAKPVRLVKGGAA
jgi:hypothetical protein